MRFQGLVVALTSGMVALAGASGALADPPTAATGSPSLTEPATPVPVTPAPATPAPTATTPSPTATPGAGSVQPPGSAAPPAGAGSSAPPARSSGDADAAGAADADDADAPTPATRSADPPAGVPRVRARRRGPPRARGPIVSLGWRYTPIATEGVEGGAHAVWLTLQPFARERTYFRGSVGAEVAFRRGPGDHVDPLAWLSLGAGAQWPGRVATPYAQAVVQVGFAARDRFFRTIFDPAYMFGLEAGLDVRVVAFVGLTVAVGGGRTVVGDQYSYGWWVRAGVGFW